ncbi:MAG: YggT family protein [Streptosporangiales bacterium]|nr:YggT family protein [Streptosporangiales bacterium]MBO0891838.1 YggT family protein [Acidothermales bacterium]
MYALVPVIYVLRLFLYALLGRLVLDYVQMFARSWVPHGFWLVVCEGVYTVTDPPMRLLRRVIPPLRFGGVSLDLSFIVLFFAVIIVTRLLMGLV